MMSVVTTSALVMFAYFVSNVFESINVEVAIGEYINNLNMPLVVMALVLPLFTAILEPYLFVRFETFIIFGDELLFQIKISLFL